MQTASQIMAAKKQAKAAAKIARHASAQVAKFQRTFGVALINLQDLVQVA